MTAMATLPTRLTPTPNPAPASPPPIPTLHMPDNRMLTPTACRRRRKWVVACHMRMAMIELPLLGAR